jgi:hypothetical protein
MAQANSLLDNAELFQFVPVLPLVGAATPLGLFRLAGPVGALGNNFSQSPLSRPPSRLPPARAAHALLVEA